MKTIELTQGLKAAIDDEDYDRENKYSWHPIKKKNGIIYAARTCSITGRTILMHREIMEFYGKTGLIEHEDGDGLNNQKSNLRESNNSRNQLFKGSGGVTVLKQVNPSWKRKNLYRARVRVNGHSILDKCFPTYEEAKVAYERARQDCRDSL